MVKVKKSWQLYRSPFAAWFCYSALTSLNSTSTRLALGNRNPTKVLVLDICNMAAGMLIGGSQPIGSYRGPKILHGKDQAT